MDNGHKLATQWPKALPIIIIGTIYINVIPITAATHRIAMPIAFNNLTSLSPSVSVPKFSLVL